MKSTILITPTTNIENNAVVDNKKVEERTYDSHMDVFTFLDTKRNQKRKANLMNVSLYDDVIVENDVNFVILRMLSK